MYFCNNSGYENSGHVLLLDSDSVKLNLTLVGFLSSFFLLSGADTGINSIRLGSPIIPVNFIHQITV